MAVVKHQGRAFAAAAAVAAATVAGALGAGQAQAAPIGVQQLPATAIVANGPADWSVFTAFIQIHTSDKRGWVVLTAPSGDCGRYGVANALVRLDYTNLTTGARGSGTVNPCGGHAMPPTSARLHTGSGQIVGSIIIPTAGAWAIPGGATFSVG
ncbi:hypothetical protein GYA93_19325 [Gordonia desulfuricans]|uniref:Uncharacterized protein n=1 Tax=Gordonia desulfuricans TaxID=89051 RepID=A0A7K3LVY8_9ACTN|nr:hypothetical protein [Gordonia desulfuricans]NDK91707.1 hypothetical protein [Gordonia desulfuricans]